MKMLRGFVKIFFVLCVILSLASIYSQYLIYIQERQEEEYLLLQIQEANLTNEMLLHELYHLLSDEYVEAVARELGLIRQNETLIIQIN